MQKAVILDKQDGGPISMWPRPGQPPTASFALRWTADGKGLSVTLPGSTSHPARLIGWTLISDQVVEIHVERPTATVMSLDMQLSTTVAEAPAGLDSDRPATAILEGASTVLTPMTA